MWMLKIQRREGVEGSRRQKAAGFFPAGELTRGAVCVTIWLQVYGSIKEGSYSNG